MILEWNPSIQNGLERNIGVSSLQAAATEDMQLEGLSHPNSTGSEACSDLRKTVRRCTELGSPGAFWAA